MDVIETNRLLIRPFQMEDLPEAHHLLDVDIQWAGPNRSIDWRRERLQLYVGLAHWEDTGCLYGYRAIVRRDTNEIIGITGFHPDYWSPEGKAIFWPQLLYDCDENMQKGSIELGIGYALSTQHRNQGYAAEAVRALLIYAFETLHIERVFAITDRANQASVRLMQRVGMRVASNPDNKVIYPAFTGVITEI